MKATANHPNYRPTKITCACGEVVETFSTKGDFGIDICSHCHPFYTGKQKLVDTAGRIERFNRKFGQIGVDGNQASADSETPAE